VYFKLSNDKFGNEEERDRLFALEDELERVIEGSGVGEYDGNEVGGGVFTCYMYSPSADELFEAIIPIINSFSALPGSYVVKRYEEHSAKEIRIEL